MAAKKDIITKEGYQKLIDERDELKNVRKPANLQKLKEAKEQGDLSENAEYDAAREEQREIEVRLAEIENILKNSEIMKYEDIDITKVHVGCEVKVLDIEFDEEVLFRIVGTNEVNVMENFISYECPVGKALLKHGAGDIVDVKLSDGSIAQYKILEVIAGKE